MQGIFTNNIFSNTMEKIIETMGINELRSFVNVLITQYTEGYLIKINNSLPNFVYLAMHSSGNYVVKKLIIQSDPETLAYLQNYVNTYGFLKIIKSNDSF